MDRLRRLAGALLLIAGTVPAYRLLRPDESGPWGGATLRLAETTLVAGLWGALLTLLLALLVGVVLGRSGSGDGRFDAVDRAARAIAGVSARASVAGAAVLAGVASAVVASTLYRGLLTNVDEMTAWLHARYLAAGLPGGPVGSDAAHWIVPNTLVIDGTWMSQYPPVHLWVVSWATALGGTRWIGPLLTAVFAGASAAALLRLLPSRPVAARLAGWMLAASPFVVFLGGGALSHLTAGAALAVALWAALRARDGHAGWAVVAGLAMGAAVGARPWTGLVLGTMLTVGVWVFRTDAGPGRSASWWGARLAGWGAGGAPFAVALGLYNARMFGGPLRFGYEALYGPRHGLGFHLDPWSYPYGLREAVGYTSADLISMGTLLIETPLSVLPIVGLYLLLARRAPRGTGLLLAWALAPVAANAVYWFHQPRMLFEAAPAWIALVVLAFGEAMRVGRADGPVASGLERMGRRALWSVPLIALVSSALVFTPSRWRSYQWSPDTLARVEVPRVLQTGEPSVVFVHTSWMERLSATLQEAGMRVDSVQAVLRRNDVCAIQRYAEARSAGTPLPPLDRTQAPGAPPGIGRVDIGPDVSVPVLPGMRPTGRCLQEARADRFGVVSLAPLVWQGDLPGIEGPGPLFVRDLGPTRNRALLARYPDREAYLFGPAEVGGPPVVAPYEEGEARLWGGGGGADPDEPSSLSP